MKRTVNDMNQNDRDCPTCINHTEKGCSAWSCKYVSREKALRAVKAINDIWYLVKQYEDDGDFSFEDLMLALNEALGEVTEDE